MNARQLLTIAAAWVCGGFCYAQQSAGPVSALLDGVSEIAAPGVPGPLVIFGDHAVPIATGKADGKTLGVVVAAAQLDKGRVVAFGHTGYAAAPAPGQTAKLVENAIRWCAAGDSQPASLAIVTNDAEWETALRKLGFSAVKRLEGRPLLDALKSAKVLCLNQQPRSDEEITAIRQFIRDGGGLLAAGLGWGWLQLNPTKSIHDHPLNRLLAPAGILWADGSLDRTTADGYKIAPPPPACNASQALSLVESSDRGDSSIARSTIEQAGATVTLAARTLPAADTVLRPRLAKLLADRAPKLIPSEKSPITIAHPLDRILLAWQLAQPADHAERERKPHPAADEFPGRVPDDAASVERSVTIDAAVADWHSTGLYARAGSPITVTLPADAAQAGLKLRIGAHTDELWHLDSWKRVPEITTETPLKTAATKSTNAFGGPIYIVVPHDCKAGKIAVRIAGGVEMPRYVHGETTLDEWRSHIRSAPAPWAELESRKIILTIPSRVVRQLDRPDEVMNFWDQLSDAHATLAQIPLERKRPERFVADVQISAGYMHSGYPIMTHLDVAELYVDIPKIVAGGGWGFFHELGHNHQAGDWTFDGTGEVTCNLFSLHAMETICKLPSGKRGHDAVDKPPSIANYIAAGAKFADWKRDPFLALQFYVQLRDAFGWEPFKQVFAEYRKLPAAERPKTDDDKRDQWMVRFSRRVGKNLGPFFEAWGVPTSATARESIKDLPAWMPEGFPPR